MSVFTAATFLILLIFSPFSIASALPCPECEEEYPPAYPAPVIVTEPCNECEHGHPPPPVVITEPCDECDHHPQTPPPVIVTETCHECEQHHHATAQVLTETISVCRRTSSTKSITPFTSGTHTYLISSCVPSTMWYTHNITEESCLPPSTTTLISTSIIYRNGTIRPGNTVAPVQTAYPPNGSTITLTITKPGSAPAQIETSISISYAPPTTERVTYTSYASGSPPATITIVTTQVQTATTREIITTQKIVPTRIMVTKRITFTIPASTERITTTERETETSYAQGSPPATVTMVTTRVQTATTQQVVSTQITKTRRITTTLPASTTRITTTLPASTTRITTTERQTLTSYASGSPPAVITIRKTVVETSDRVSTERITATTTVVSTASAPKTVMSTIVRIRVVTSTITSVLVSSAPPETVFTTQDITHTKQLPAHTSYATLTKGTQTITRTLSVATQTITTRPPMVTQTSVLPASTIIVITTRPASTRIITKTATSEEVLTTTVTITPATPPARTMVRTRTITATASFYSTAFTTTTITVTKTQPTRTQTATLTTTEELQPPSCTPSTSTLFRTKTKTISPAAQTQTQVQTVTQVRTTTEVRTVVSTQPAQTQTQVQTVTKTKAGQPAGYCTPSTVTKTLPAHTTRATITVTEIGQPPNGYDSTTTVTKTRTIDHTTTAACNTPVRKPVANCKAPTGSFRIVIQNFGAAYLTSTSGGASPNGDHETLGFTSNAAKALSFSAVSNGQTTFVTTGSQTLYSGQQDDNAGNGPVYYDSLDAVQGYGPGEQAVQFCLQADNSFLVQNPTDGATDVMMCAGVIYLLSAANAANSGCTPVTLVKA